MTALGRIVWVTSMPLLVITLFRYAVGRGAPGGEGVDITSPPVGWRNSLGPGAPTVGTSEVLTGSSCKYELGGWVLIICWEVEEEDGEDEVVCRNSPGAGTNVPDGGMSTGIEVVVKGSSSISCLFIISTSSKGSNIELRPWIGESL